MEYKWHRNVQNPNSEPRTKEQLRAEKAERLEVRREIGYMLFDMEKQILGDDVSNVLRRELIRHLGHVLSPDPYEKDIRIMGQLQETRAETKAKRDYWKEGVKPSDRPKPRPDRESERER